MAYEITHKTSEGTSRVPLLMRWRQRGRNGGPEVLTSDSQLQGYLSQYYPKTNWELVCTTVTGSATVYTFRSIPAPDSRTMENPGKYPEHYHHVRAVQR